MRMRKRIDALEVADLEMHPVWTISGSDSAGNPLVEAVLRVPVASTRQRRATWQEG